METSTEAPIAPLVALSTLGTLLTAQDVTRQVLAHTPDADAELVAEETLALLATLSARALEAGLRQAPALARQVVPTLLDLPLLYRDYLTAGILIATRNPELAGTGEEAYRRLRKKMEFYHLHFPAGRYPSTQELKEKLEFWMGRISPPGQAASPMQRLEQLDLLPLIQTHMQVLVARGRQLTGAG